MKNIKYQKLLIIMLVLIIAIYAVNPIPRKYKTNPWMKDLSNDTKISEMVIPGSHDSGATRSFFDVSGKCQDMSIKNQLQIGVRFFDIRLQLVNDELVVVHSFVDQKLNFEEVIEDIEEFLNKYESEFIIISIKEDNSSKNSSLDFEDVVIKELSKIKRMCFDKHLPKTLQEARGKVYLLNRFSTKEIGIQAYYGWQDSTTFEIDNLYVQDNYCVSSFLNKKDDIEKTFEYSKTAKDKLILNFTSCYLDNAFPPTYAGDVAKPVNKYINDYLNENDNLSGIIIMDFVTEKLVKKVYMENNYESSN